MKHPIITFTSDFGCADFYVAAVKGVLLSSCPHVNIVDISHEIQRWNIYSGAVTFSDAAKTFPKGTVHLAVVDPGVGSKRKGIIVECLGQYFVGPDNGLVSFFIFGKKYRVWEILSSKNNKNKVSPTFHGRDVFAPVAAQLAKGISPNRLGKKMEQMALLKMCNEFKKNKIICRILSIDHYGNVQTSLSQSDLRAHLGAKKFTVKIKRHVFKKHVSTYASMPKGQPCILLNSSGRFEIALNQASAAAKYKLVVGDAVHITI